MFQAVFIVAFTYLLWFWLVRRYPASGLTSFTFLSPAHGVILGGLLLNEPLSMHIFMALALIAAGLFLVNRPARDASIRAEVEIMRELLNDLEAGRASCRTDPVERARAQMRQPLPKRFYKEVGRSEGEGGFRVLLDGKPVRTPGRALLALPTEPPRGSWPRSSRPSARKWTSPQCRCCGSPTPRSTASRRTRRRCWRTSCASPPAISSATAPNPGRNCRATGGMLGPGARLGASALSARMVLAEGVMHVEQPREAIAAIGVHLGLRREPFRLAALHVMTSLMGSALLALAVETGELSPEEAWVAAHVDEDWNIEQWGEDAEAAPCAPPASAT
jgi:hypothetical protein